MIALIDYGAGNLHSVENALRAAGARIEGERGRRMTVIATGGLAPLFDQADGLFHSWDDDLTMHGLRLIHDYNKEMGNV